MKNIFRFAESAAVKRLPWESEAGGLQFSIPEVFVSVPSIEDFAVVPFVDNRAAVLLDRTVARKGIHGSA
jgi:hypothetical protein